MVMKLDAPIPGQSLTTEPGNSPWEQPPKYAKVDQAIAFYLDKFSNDEKLDDLLNVLEQGMPLSVLVESLMTMGVMNGLHTMDVSIMAAPVIHEYLRTMAENVDIAVKESDAPTRDDRDKARMKQRMSAEIAGLAGEMKKSGGGPAPLPPPQEQQMAAASQVPPQGAPQGAAPPQAGLINRR